MSGKKGLSICIPVYKFNPAELISALLEQMETVEMPVELFVVDDASGEDFKNTLMEQVGTKAIRLELLEKNLGRAAIRNYLAKNAKYDQLLFLDGDSGIVHANFLERYLLYHPDFDIVYGGTNYPFFGKLDKSCILHLKNGRKREALPARARNKALTRFISFNNLWVRKEIMLDYPLNEDIKGYGHEDTHWCQHLPHRKLKILHIDNAVWHKQLFSNSEFLDRIKEASQNLKKLQNEGFDFPGNPLFQAENALKKTGLLRLYLSLTKLFMPLIKFNLKSRHPSLRFLDLYKLYHFSKARP